MKRSPKMNSVARAWIIWSVRCLAVASSIWLSLLLSYSTAFADAASGSAPNLQNLQNSPMIFDVRRSLPLEPTEPVYHDFYINAGAEAGFHRGLYVNVVRLVPVHNPIVNKQQAELPVNVARLQILQVSPNITVARLITEFSDEERPALEFESVMIGDRVDLSSITAESPKKKLKTAHDRRVFDESATAILLERQKNEPRASEPEVAKAPPPPAAAPAPEPPADAAKSAQVQLAPVTTLASADPTQKNSSPNVAAPAMVPVPAPKPASPH